MNSHRVRALGPEAKECEFQWHIINSYSPNLGKPLRTTASSPLVARGSDCKPKAATPAWHTSARKRQSASTSKKASDKNRRKSKSRPEWDSTVSDLTKHRLTKREVVANKVKHTSRNNSLARQLLEREGVSLQEQEEVFRQVLGPQFAIRTATTDKDASALVSEQQHEQEQEQPQHEQVPEHLVELYQELLQQISAYEKASHRTKIREVRDPSTLEEFAMNVLETCGHLVCYLSEGEIEISRKREMIELLEDQLKAESRKVRALEDEKQAQVELKQMSKEERMSRLVLDEEEKHGVLVTSPRTPKPCPSPTAHISDATKSAIQRRISRRHQLLMEYRKTSTPI